MNILNQESFCRHWCNDYDKVMKEQTEECDCIVACSSSENGMNPDAFAAQGLMMKTEEELFEEALKNFAKSVLFTKDGSFCVDDFEKYWEDNKDKLLKYDQSEIKPN